MNKLIDKLIAALKSHTFKDSDIDTLDRLSAHTEALSNKRLIREVFGEFHDLFDSLDRKYIDGVGPRIELGAGIAPMKMSYNDVISTDVVPSESVVKTLDAQNMDLGGNSVRVFFAQNAFHHFPNPDLFFNELDRVLVPGGGAILIEPYYGALAKFLYKRIFTTEGFDEKAISWVSDCSGPMNGANQALSYNIFVRDINLFQSKHHSLRVVHTALCNNYVKYLLSGGLNFRQLVPKFMEPSIPFVQKLLQPFDRHLALHHVVVIKKIQ